MADTMIPIPGNSVPSDPAYTTDDYLNHLRFQNEVSRLRAEQRMMAEQERRFLRGAAQMSQGADKSREDIETFRRYQNLRAMESALKRGVPPGTAALQNPGAYLTSEVAAKMALSQMGGGVPLNEFKTINDPITGEPMVDTLRTGPESVSPRWRPTGDPSTSDRIRIAGTLLSNTQSQLEALGPPLEDDPPEVVKQRNTLTTTAQELQNELRTMMAPRKPGAPTTAPPGAPAASIGPVTNSLTAPVKRFRRYVPGQGIVDVPTP